MSDNTAPGPMKRRPASLRQEAEMIAGIKDPVGRIGLRMAFHARRYSVLYSLGVLAAIAVLVMPTVAETAHSGLAAGTQSNNTSSGSTQTAANPGASAAPTSVSTAGSGAAATAAVGTVSAGTGVTRGGFQCSPGVGQIPWSQYTPPCVAAFTGNNGGATWNGVTGTTITLAMRHCTDSTGPNAVAVDQESMAAGGESYEDEETHVEQLIAYFNRTFELYGRHVQVQDFSNAQGNCTNESTGTGQAQACSDADFEANTMHAFTGLNWQGLFESEPFAQCAARYHMYLGFAQLYFPESEYQAEDPYIWAPTPSCTEGGTEEAEFIGKQLAPFPAKWAGTDEGLSLNGQTRKFGVYIPTNPGYQQCEQNTRNIDAQKYGMNPDNNCGTTVGSNCRWDIYKYPLDISQWPQDAQQAAIQFASDHDTTVVLASDPLSPIFLTQDADNQNYHPEWMLTGVALTDQDNLAQLWDQAEIKGHLFGLSQLGSSAAAQAPNGEATRTLKAAGVKVDPGTILNYYELLPIFDQLQSAGPLLTPANIAAGTHRLPRMGGATAPDGTWDYGSSHTAIIDSREIYYIENQNSPANGKAGTYIQIYGGQRFGVGQYPTGEPPYYPNGPQ